jgi:hypothetical protein
MICFDEQNPPELVEEAVKMDTAIQATEDGSIAGAVQKHPQ